MFTLMMGCLLHSYGGMHAFAWHAYDSEQLEAAFLSIAKTYEKVTLLHIYGELQVFPHNRIEKRKLTEWHQ